MSLINLYQCRECKAVFPFKFNAGFEEDGFCPICKSSNFDIIVEAIEINSEEIKKKYGDE